MVGINLKKLRFSYWKTLLIKVNQCFIITTNDFRHETKLHVLVTWWGKCNKLLKIYDGLQVKLNYILVSYSKSE